MEFARNVLDKLCSPMAAATAQAVLSGIQTIIVIQNSLNAELINFLINKPINASVLTDISGYLVNALNALREESTIRAPKTVT